MDPTVALPRIPPVEERLSRSQAARVLGLGMSATAATLKASPPLRWYRIGWAWFTTERDIAEWIEARSRPASTAPVPVSTSSPDYRRRVQDATAKARSLMASR